jgi:hypothetical protein
MEIFLMIGVALTTRKKKNILTLISLMEVLSIQYKCFKERKRTMSIVCQLFYRRQR